jgi:predicted NAD-dependent protein-ADP-ribosyltransferase YbiA (DUF1768 family)
MEVTKFYGRTSNPKYWPFSNFYPAEFVDNAGTSWKTTEHYFQAMKFLPEDIISIGFKQEKSLREYIYNALLYKFTQHHELKQLLLETEDTEIIEDSPVDWYWGCGKDGSGKNMLGILLMKLRENLRKG